MHTRTLCLFAIYAGAAVLLKSGLPAQTSPPAATITALSAGAPTLVTNGGFEDTTVGSGNFSIPHTGWSGWTFSGSGIAHETSAYFSSNQSTANGSYVAIVKNQGTLESSGFSVSSAGLYRVRFFSAQREQGTTSNEQVLSVKLNGITMFREKIATTTMQEYVTRPIKLNSTSLTITFSGHTTTDETAFVDQVRIEPVSDWGNTTHWNPARLPTSTDHVVVPSGVEMGLTGAGICATLQVQGELLVPNVNTSLSARWVLVKGAGSALECGAPDAPFEQNFDLTLTGSSVNENILGGGSKFLMAMDGGYIDLHGKPRVSWTKLAATAAQNALSLSLIQSVNWQSGDQIVIAPSKNSVTGIETRSLTSGGNGTNTVGFAGGLANMHLGTQSTYTRPTPAKTWTLDQRAEVGLLTHNITVQGDSNSEVSGFGGHIMIMNCPACATSGYGRFSNVRLYRMGQKSILGRYPIHWHMQGSNGQGQFIRDSSVHHSFNRAIVIHGTDYVNVQRNVCYDHIGHGIFLEDGSERFNTITDNLVLDTKKPAAGEELLDSDNGFNEPQNRSPAAFWITNPNNIINGNVAAGTPGTGYWFALPHNPIGLSAAGVTPGFTYTGLHPDEEALGSFNDNVAHSVGSGLDSNDSLNPNGSLKKNVSWAPPSTATFNRFTCYSALTAIYSGGGGGVGANYDNCVLADNESHFFVAAYQTLSQSALIANTAQGVWPNNKRLYAYSMYDGAGRLRDSHIVGYNVGSGNNITSLFESIGGSNKHVNHLFSGLTYSPNSKARIELTDYAAANPNTSLDGDPRRFSVAMWDEDGSLTGTAGRTLIGNHPMLKSAGDVSYTSNGSLRAFISNKHFTRLELSYPALGVTTAIPDVRITRSDTAGSAAVVYNYLQKNDPHHQMALIANSTFRYTVDYDAYAGLPGNVKGIKTLIDDAFVGDVSLICFKTLASKTNLKVGNWASYSSMAALTAANSHGYWADNATGNLWLRFKNTALQNFVTIQWD
jgi:hypothetical protein